VIPLLLEVAKWILIVISILLFLFLVLLRLVRHYFHFPTPSFALPLIDNRIRRALIQNPSSIADRMELEPGIVVLEIGPGTGTYSQAIAERVLPDGKVFAVDIQEHAIRRLKERVKKEGPTNIYPRVDNAYNMSFPDESIDRVLAMSALPEIPNPVLVLRECHRVLKPNGLLCLCELIIDPDYPRKSTEKKWAQQADFKLEKEFGNIVSYQLNFKKT